MRIENRPSGQPVPRIDLTRPTREAIESEAAKVAAAMTAKDADSDAANVSLHKRAKHARANLAEIAAKEKAAERIDGARERYNEKVAFRERVHNARVRLSGDRPSGPDKLQISPEAALLSETAIAPRPQVSQTDDARADQIRQLKSLADSGRLNSDEMIARAAHKMLGGE